MTGKPTNPFDDFAPEAELCEKRASEIDDGTPAPSRPRARTKIIVVETLSDTGDALDAFASIDPSTSTVSTPSFHREKSMDLFEDELSSARRPPALRSVLGVLTRSMWTVPFASRELAAALVAIGVLAGVAVGRFGDPERNLLSHQSYTSQPSAGRDNAQTVAGESQESSRRRPPLPGVDAPEAAVSVSDSSLREPSPPDQRRSLAVTNSESSPVDATVTATLRRAPTISTEAARANTATTDPFVSSTQLAASRLDVALATSTSSDSVPALEATRGTSMLPQVVAAVAAVPAAVTTARIAIESALSRYTGAFSALDAEAAKAVWRDVDERALRRAFAQLEEQTVHLDACDISVSDVEAVARCSGTLEYIRKVGRKSVTVEPREWTFRLRQRADEWSIEGVDSR